MGSSMSLEWMTLAGYLGQIFSNGEEGKLSRAKRHRLISDSAQGRIVLPFTVLGSDGYSIYSSEPS